MQRMTLYKAGTHFPAFVRALLPRCHKRVTDLGATGCDYVGVVSSTHALCAPSRLASGAWAAAGAAARYAAGELQHNLTLT